MINNTKYVIHIYTRNKNDLVRDQQRVDGSWPSWMAT